MALELHYQRATVQTTALMAPLKKAVVETVVQRPSLSPARFW